MYGLKRKILSLRVLSTTDLKGTGLTSWSSTNSEERKNEFLFVPAVVCSYTAPIEVHDFCRIT